MRLKTLSKGLALVCQWSAAAIFIFVCGLNFSQVFGRYILGSSIPWGEEIMRYSMIWVMMLGGTASIYYAEHMAVESLGELLAPHRRHLVLTTTYLVGGLFCVLLVYYGWPATMANTRQTAAASGISMFWVYLAIPAGALLMLIQIVLCAISGFASANAEPERL
ncbi:TRAP transporter small permease [Pelagibacterium nitratireducens]|jgi:TRAP-type C4-dicarboxylate transport system permease small subunit|uniref:TRAP transporter small permease protein n=1 Tax=Pelagibacterium nitratireducens TaxID=1046114 RepID=A0ABZ2I1R4_9HYPH|nr:C4-dicarboxylate ABC transporter permease [Pelagibacterium sp.]HCO54981.1 TRAP transporter small permease [Pelagibacterium sp.]|tara:strand:+ start:20140 stop:20631 length:492 start_codon:yes stop_codon:yes gene_type:complete